MTFKKCFSSENLKKAFYYIRGETEKDNFNILPFWSGTISIIEEINDEFFIALSESIYANQYSPDRPFFLYAKKDINFWVRPISVLSVIDRVVYQAIFNPEILGGTVENTLSEYCFANHIDLQSDPVNNRGHFLKEYHSQYYNGFVEYNHKSFDEDFCHFAKVDVEGYYENINPWSLNSILIEEFWVDTELAGFLCDTLLWKWSEFWGNSVNLWIPQWPDASSVIANIYLNSLDKSFVARYGSKVRYSRYNDDIIIIAKDINDLYSSIDFIVTETRKKWLKTNAKWGIFLSSNKKELESILCWVSWNESFVDPNIKNWYIRSQVTDFFIKKDIEKKNDTNSKSALRYYLSKWYNPNSKFDKGYLDRFIQCFIDVPYLTDKLMWYLVKPYKIVDWRFFGAIDEPEIFEKVFLLYKTSYLTNWQKFNLLKLLNYSSVSREDSHLSVEFASSVMSEFEKWNTPHTQMIILRYYLERKHADVILNDRDAENRILWGFLNKLESGLEPIIVATIFWTLRTRKELLKWVLSKYLYSHSHEIQLIVFYYLKQIEWLETALQDENRIGGLLKKLLRLPDKEDLFSKTSNESNTSKEELFPIHIQENKSLTKKNKSVNKKSKKQSKKIIFEEVSWKITYLKETLWYIQINTREFFFFKCLYDNYWIAIKHEKLSAEIRQRGSNDSKLKKEGELTNIKWDINSVLSTIKERIIPEIKEYIHSWKWYYQLLEDPIKKRKYRKKKR